MAANPDRRGGVRLLYGALLGSALFICLPLPPPPASAQPCAADRLDEQAQVRRVHDGDTVILSDGRKVRLIGINTPELVRNRVPAEAFSADARTLLQTLLAEGGFRVGLRHGAERYDRYSRSLAHVFTSDGRNVQELLLQHGLAAPIAFPPNLWQQPCYLQTAQRAREAQRGIWSLPRYQGVHPRAVRATGGGFYAVRGRIESVKRTRHSVWLNMGYDFGLRIAKDDLLQFRSLTPDSLRLKSVRALGWVNVRKRPSMRIRHPSQLEIVK
ncbi:MAG: thermonuclease family protein [Gammaproteobacteria bacterium]|nr:thermonuclease family protein [Gammaproteobacteria bacterium]